MQKIIYLSIRYLSGGAMAFFGVNNLFHVLPPHTFSGKAGQVMLSFESAGYIIPAVGISQLILAAALLTNRYIPLALLLFAPMVVNILLFHLFLDMQGILMVLPLTAVMVYLFLQHKSSFFHLIKK